jgi:hypothetical protein
MPVDTHEDIQLAAGVEPVTDVPEKAYGGAIYTPELTQDPDDLARRLILWSYAAAPVARPLSRAEGGAAEYPVAMPTEIKEDLKHGEAKLRNLSPDEFLKEADPLHIGHGDRNIIHSFEKHIQHGDHLGPLKLYEGGHQDGRHRANAAKALGVKKVPVIDYRKADGGPVDPVEAAKDTARNLTPMGFYSAASEAASKIPQKAPIDQILNKLKGSPNVKAEELDQSGVRDAFAGQKSVDPQEVARHLQENLPQVQEKVLRDPYAIGRELMDKAYALKMQGKLDEADALNAQARPYMAQYRSKGPNDAKYGEYQLSDPRDDFTVGNYRELLLHLPEKIDTDSSAKAAEMARSLNEKYGERWASLMTFDEVKKYEDLLKSQESAEKVNNYKSGHWGETPNVLAHIRMSDRGFAFQKPYLHVEEVQSDWGQNKRDGEDVPEGPHIGSTEGWTDLALKRILQEAAKGDYKKILFTAGKDQSDRYGLDKKFESIRWSPDTKELLAEGLEGLEDIEEKVHAEALPGFIGKDLADKLLSQPIKTVGNKQVHLLRGGDLKIENKGMRNYYDRKLPERMNKLVAQLDPSIKMKLFDHTINLGTETDDGEDRIHHLHSLEMTPKLREAILKGLPAYDHGGEVGKDRGGSIIKRALAVLSGLPK